MIGIDKEMPTSCSNCFARLMSINEYDDFESVCRLSENKKIFQKELLSIPDWCPLIDLSNDMVTVSAPIANTNLNKNLRRYENVY